MAAFRAFASLACSGIRHFDFLTAFFTNEDYHPAAFLRTSLLIGIYNIRRTIG
ncbi:MAG: hypothetical protein WDA68_02310 [Phycisphaerae bacterium]